MSELFKAYEVVRVPYWPKVARIVIPSVILHTALIAAVAFVPAIQDMLHLRKMVGDIKMVDRDYKKTQIADNVQVVDLATDDVFRYPEGYFSTEQQLPPGIDPVVLAQVTPTPTPTPIPIPVAPKVVMPPMARNRMPRGPANNINSPNPTASPSPSPTPTDYQAANAQADQIARDNGISRPHDDEINRAPLKDFVKKANDLFEQGKLDFSKPVEVVIEADLDDNARLVNPQVITKSGNVPLDDIAKDMVSALSDSGALKFLTRIEGSKDLRHIRFTIKMDSTSFNTDVESEVPSNTQAKQMANGFAGLLALVPFIREGHPDEIAIAKGTTVRADGKKLIANFAMPRQQAIDLMKKQVAANAKPES